MKEQSWKDDKIERAGWPAGPWSDEPDKMQWIDDATGMACLAVRHPHSGHWCGYVGVEPGHMLHGKDYGAAGVFTCGDTCEEGEDGYHYGCTPQAHLEAHGGITFADKCQHSTDPCRGVCHIAEPGKPDELWWFGFDCAHCGDCSPRDYELKKRGYPFSPVYGVYRDLGYVREQCAHLAQQLAAMQPAP